MSKLNSFKNQTGPPIKRKRIVTACSNCRKRKIKCDKCRPFCQACSKSKISCTYQEPSWNNHTSMQISSNYMNAASVPMAHIGTNTSQSSTQSQDNSPQFQRLEFQAKVDTKIEHDFTLKNTEPYQVSNNNNNVQHLESNIRKTQEVLRLAPFRSVHSHSHSIPSINEITKESKCMSFYDYEEPITFRAGRFFTAGPLSLPSMIKKDPFLKVNALRLRKQRKQITHHWTHFTLKTSKELVKEIIVQDKSSLSNKLVDERFQKTLIENEGIDEIKMPGSLEQNINDPTLSKTHVFNLNRQGYEAETILKIQEVLPHEKLIWILLDKYFNGILSVFMPMISEELFKEKMVEIIGQRKDRKAKIESILLSKRFDFAYMGILLIILRLTSLSVTKTSNNTAQEQYILENPIGLSAVNVAQMCLNQFKLFRRGAIPIMQCCLFMRFYHKFAPEDGDGSDGGDGQVFLGMLLQMANSVGLNRDLKHGPSLLSNDGILTNTWRMIWHEIVSLDLRQSLILGDPILIDEDYYDTLLPSLESEFKDSLTTNYAIHSSVVKNFHINDEINTIIRDILKMILSIKKLVNVGELLPKLQNLESFINKKFKDLKTILMLKNFTLEDTSSKLFNFINYVELKTSLYVIYYNIFIKFPKDYKRLFFKLVEISMELNPLAYLLITTNNETTNYFDSIFGAGSQLIIIPTLITSLQKTHQIQCGIISRSLDIKFNHKDFQNYSIIIDIYEEMVKKYNLSKDGFQNLSSDYFHCWRTSKATNLLGKIFTDSQNNIWDKNSEIYKKALNDPSLIDELNHAKNIPSGNEFLEMNEFELNKLLEMTTNNETEEIFVHLLNRGRSNNDSPNGMNNAYIYESPLPTIYSDNAQYRPLSHLHQPQPQPQPSSTSQPLSQTPPQFPPPSSINSILNIAKREPLNAEELHVNKNSKTNLEIDRLWIQMLTNNTGTGRKNGTGVYNETPPTDEEQLSSADNNVDNDTANAQDASIKVGLDNQMNSGMNYSVFDSNSLGLEGFDLDKLMGGASLYDMFGDI